MKKLTVVTALALLMSACASTQPTTTAVNTLPVAEAPLKFAITGKIGITTVSDNGKQAGSAFYAWSQENQRFGIDLTGALGIGATQIRYNGTTATLTSERTGTISADSPEDLLYTATGWQAPISQLPYWIVGRATPDDTDTATDSSGRLIRATHGAWLAVFDYDKGNQPSRLRISHSDGHKVTLSITHQ
ncbi:lipoprotein insertase outer membrane protein LolB [Moraxella marmotae]|uniref:lipoprotein insertase outer membrane protein LolB n=1 Tax=Moraxella marmotae TaxID=3344520 RepID=UPI0035F25660